MPRIQPIDAIVYDAPTGADVSLKIAPPYDVLDAASKADLLARDEHNIVKVDLPHTPAKTLGPDEAYENAGKTFRDWLERGVLVKRDRPALFVYQQTFAVGDVTYKRRGLIANVAVQPFGPAPDGHGGVYPHEQTFSAAKQDRLKLMTATGAQLSPIFGLYSDPEGRVQPLLDSIADASGGRGGPTAHGHTLVDPDVQHDVWAVDDADTLSALQDVLRDADVFIADGHHRYNTAINYRQQTIDAGEIAADAPSGGHPADWCMFVLISMQDPGMVVLPTHRVLGGMNGFSVEAMVTASYGRLKAEPFAGGDAAALEAALPSHGPHAMGLVERQDGGQKRLWVLTTTENDPLAATHGDKSEAWRGLDVAVLQHLIVEQVCQPTFGTGDEPLAWKFPHQLSQLGGLLADDPAAAGVSGSGKTDNGYQLGVILQATPLDSVRQVSEAGELMPQKSTFFYPKLATGFVVNPVKD